MTEEENELDHMDEAKIATGYHLHRTREDIEAKYGVAWDMEEFEKDFELINFHSPFVYVKHRANGNVFMLAFQHYPRFYFGPVVANEQIGYAMALLRVIEVGREKLEDAECQNLIENIMK